MAGTASFDVSTGADLQEVDNAVNQAVKEISQRYDFKGTHVTIEFDRTRAVIKLDADDEFRMKQVLEVVEAKCAKRGVPLKNLKTGDMIPGAGTSVRCEIALTQGIPQDIAKKIQKAIKEQGFKKVQSTIQGDELRITSPSKDELQTVIAFLRSQDFELELKFGNFRG
jgi:cyclic-di-GMP-binding protein